MQSFLRIVLIESLLLMSFSAFSKDKAQLLYGETGKLDAYDPYTAHEIASQRLSDLIFDSLVILDTNGNYLPSLAKKWSISPDNTAVTFDLREDVLWHSDHKSSPTSFSAHDVLTTIKIIKNESSDIPNNDRFNIVSHGEIINKNKITIKLNRSSLDPLKSLSFKILPSHILGSAPYLKRSSEFTKKPIGTGPYKIVKISNEGEILLEANNNYFAGVPHIKSIIMKSYANQNIMSQSLMYNSLDLITYVSPSDLDEIAGDKRLNLLAYDALSYSFIAFNTERGVLKDKRIRQALSYAINREEMLQAFFQGKGSIISGPFPPTSWAYNLDVKPTKFDQNTAKTLFQNAGLSYSSDNKLLDKNGKPIKLTFTVPISGESEIIKRIVLAYQGYLNDVGINLDIQFMDWQLWKERVLGKHDYDLTIASWSFDDSSNIMSLFHSNSAKPWGNNFVLFKNPIVDSLLTEVSVTNDFDKRRAINHKIHAILADEMPYTYLWTLKHHAAFDNNLVGVKIEPFSFFRYVLNWNFKTDK